MTQSPPPKHSTFPAEALEVAREISKMIAGVLEPRLAGGDAEGNDWAQHALAPFANAAIGRARWAWFLHNGLHQVPLFWKFWSSLLSEVLGNVRWDTAAFEELRELTTNMPDEKLFRVTCNRALHCLLSTNVPELPGAVVTALGSSVPPHRWEPAVQDVLCEFLASDPTVAAARCTAEPLFCVDDSPPGSNWALFVAELPRLLRERPYYRRSKRRPEARFWEHLLGLWLKTWWYDSAARAAVQQARFSRVHFREPPPERLDEPPTVAALYAWAFRELQRLEKFCWSMGTEQEPGSAILTFNPLRVRGMDLPDYVDYLWRLEERHEQAGNTEPGHRGLTTTGEHALPPPIDHELDLAHYLAAVRAAQLTPWQRLSVEGYYFFPVPDLEANAAVALARGVATNAVNQARFQALTALKEQLLERPRPRREDQELVDCVDALLRSSHVALRALGQKRLWPTDFFTLWLLGVAELTPRQVVDTIRFVVSEPPDQLLEEGTKRPAMRAARGRYCTCPTACLQQCVTDWKTSANAKL